MNISLVINIDICCCSICYFYLYLPSSSETFYSISLWIVFSSLELFPDHQILIMIYLVMWVTTLGQHPHWIIIFRGPFLFWSRFLWWWSWDNWFVGEIDQVSINTVPHYQYLHKSIGFSSFNAKMMLWWIICVTSKMLNFRISGISHLRNISNLLPHHDLFHQKK